MSTRPAMSQQQVEAAGNKLLALSASHLSTYLEACLHCGLCASACHFHEVSGDPRHTPAYKLFPMARAYKRSKSPLNWFGLTKTVTQADLDEWEELIFDTCTMCGRCSTVCPMGIDIAAIVAGTRQAFAAAGLGPEDLMQAADNVRDHGSPLKVSKSVLEDRLEWIADEHDTVIPLDKKGAEVLFTVSSIELMKYPDSVGAMAQILNAGGVNWTVSTTGYESTNFGYLSGKPDLAKLGVTRIVEAAETAGIKTVIIPECGHAYTVLRWAGANILGRPLPFEVFHITEYLAKLKREGKVSFTPTDEAFTYHDPCQISRRGGAEADARYLLDGFAPNFREMAPTGNYNWCCGGGGGVQAISRAAPLRHKVFEIKAKQVAAAGTDMMVSSCANCRLTFDESIAALKWGGKLESLVEMLASHLIEKPQKTAN